MTAVAPWEHFLREHFPGYLLPDSARTALTVEEAERFLGRLTGRAHELSLLRAVSTLSPHVQLLKEFVLHLLPELVRALPSRSEVVRREWEGGFQGRLDVRSTLAHWNAGRHTSFVTHARRRSFELPENILVRVVSERLLKLCTDLRQARVLGSVGWGAELQACEGQLRHLLTATRLREVPLELLGPRHEEAAVLSRTGAHRAAARWHLILRQGLDSRDPAAIAEIIAKGALSPLKDHTRFEIAVVIRLLQALWAYLEESGGGQWTFERSLVHQGREDVAWFRRSDGTSVRVVYNQAWLGPGPSDEGAKHYLGHGGRMRPDITVLVEGNEVRRAVVVEVKLSDNRDYLARGFQEAMLYRWEYATALTGWPKAILVCSARLEGKPRAGDDVIAIGWDNWVPREVVEGMLGGL